MRPHVLDDRFDDIPRFPEGICINRTQSCDNSWILETVAGTGLDVLISVERVGPIPLKIEVHRSRCNPA